MEGAVGFLWHLDGRSDPLRSLQGGKRVCAITIDTVASPRLSSCVVPRREAGRMSVGKRMGSDSVHRGRGSCAVPASGSIVCACFLAEALTGYASNPDAGTFVKGCRFRASVYMMDAKYLSSENCRAFCGDHPPAD